MTREERTLAGKAIVEHMAEFLNAATEMLLTLPEDVRPVAAANGLAVYGVYAVLAMREVERKLAPIAKVKESPKNFVVSGISIASDRARRGEAQDDILRVMEGNPGIKAKEIQEFIERESGKTYGLSSIYRVMNFVKSKIPKDKGNA